MTDRELLDYIQRILCTCSQRKAGLTLLELREILSRSSTPSKQIKLLDQAIDNLPEAQQGAKSAPGSPLTEQDLQIAVQRGTMRRKREEEIRNMGRC